MPGFELAAHDPTPVDFASLDLDARLLDGIEDLGFTRTTPIQGAVFPLAVEGHDLVGCAATGSGKTVGFLLPLLERILRRRREQPDVPAGTSVLILAPTRELAVQIEDDFQGLSYHTGLSSIAVYGGVGAGSQDRGLRGSADIVVATPGRLMDHMNSGAPQFTNLQALVLDEADRMLDMGFWPSVRRIVSSLPENRQTLLFSATMSDEVLRSAAQIMRNPRRIQIGETGLSKTITHLGHVVRSDEKATWLMRFLRETHGRSLVFVRTKRGADRLASRLRAAGVRCAALHADRTQKERSAAVEAFRTSRRATLVATDIAARGLDIDQIDHVVNYEVPTVTDTYVHRVGRTARAGVAGTAVTLAAPDELKALRAIERELGLDIEVTEPGDSR